jgi:hypothetical protein
MFNANFVVAVKVNGKILREVGDLVYLPFGSEYSILLKNKSTLKAKALVEIDGQTATENTCLVLDPGETLELKRFIRNGNFSTGNAFRFIEKTSHVEKHRGNKADDGLITVRYEFARKPVPYVPNPFLLGGGLGSGYNTGGCHGLGSHISNTMYSSTVVSRGIVPTSSITCSTSFTDDEGPVAMSAGPEVKMSANSLRSKTKAPAAAAAAVNEAGITAPGSRVDQQFYSVADFATDGVKHAITLMLKGGDGHVQVQQPVVVKKSQICGSCGMQNKQTANFCQRCGTAVTLY